MSGQREIAHERSSGSSHRNSSSLETFSLAYVELAIQPFIKTKNVTNIPITYSSYNVSKETKWFYKWEKQ